MEKKPFVTKSQVEEIVKTYPTPFHLYDEKGIRENAKKVKEAFAWNPAEHCISNLKLRITCFCGTTAVSGSVFPMEHVC